MPRQRFDAAEYKLVQSLGTNITAKRSKFELAAGKLSPNSLETRAQRDRTALQRLARDLPRALEREKDRKRDLLRFQAARLTPAGIERQYRQGRERLDALPKRLDRSITQRLAEARNDVDQKARLLKGLSYEAVLDRGFALVRDEADKPVKQASDVSEEWRKADA
ncbi:exodeoxyribonuclease VII large subunit [Fulvimarina sp. MAC8]|uniref:exodeoxyribonuclease VII large subunit n=1 Tax=Fulvimarina sp. MAC8 TaxID=3162874 RepID=UPI0032EAFD99